jgi:hypothetical protein
MKSLFTAFLSLIAVYSFSQKEKEGEYHLNKEYKMSQTGVFKLSTSDAKVSIVGSNRATAHVKVDRVVTTKGLVFGQEEFAVEVNESGGDLEVREHSRSVSVGMIGYYHEKYTIELEVPAGVSLWVKGDDGDYQISNVAGAISLKLDDADVVLTGCSGESFEFRMDDGDIRMDQGRGKLDIEGDDTDIHIQHAAFSEVRADIDDGDLIIETSLADKGDYFIKAQDGLVSLTILQGGGTFEIRHDDGRVSTEGSFSIIEKSENEMRLTLPHGTASVNIRADDARVRLSSKL